MFILAILAAIYDATVRGCRYSSAAINRACFLWQYPDMKGNEWRFARGLDTVFGRATLTLTLTGWASKRF